MIGSNYRSTVMAFIAPSPNNQAHSAQLTTTKDSCDYIKLSEVRGHSNSNIEKMTHPLAQPDDTDFLSPYMIDLLGKTTALTFAEKTLQAPRKRLLDKLGIDDTRSQERHTRLSSDQGTISRFYDFSCTVPPIELMLNGHPFIEQEPTSPYFQGQKIITSDLRIFRGKETFQTIDLLRCTSRDDSQIAFNKAPIERLQHYNNTVFANETDLREMTGMSNTATYFVEMADFLTQRGTPGDFIVQNAFESSSDKNTPHFQFVPEHVALPIFSRPLRLDDELETQILDWHLPSISKIIDLKRDDWREKTHQFQSACQRLLNEQHISTTPIFRMMEDDQIQMYLVFKKDCSSVWEMPHEDTQLSPGWVEACGIFIANTAKAEAFNNKGAHVYYAAHSVDAERITPFFEGIG